MSNGNAYKHSSARQSRLQMESQNSEFVRRQNMYREARGKVFSHFKKRELIAEWNLEWNLSGRPSDHADFSEWLEQNRQRLIQRKEEERASQKRINESHAAYIAG